MAEGHRERLKRRFLKEGLQNFEPYQALELLLFYAIPRRDTSPTARELIKHFGSFSAVLSAPVEELKKVDGMGESSATFLHLVGQCSGYYLADLSRYKKQILSTAEAGQYLLPRFIGKPQESLYLLCMDNSRRIVYEGLISEGSVDVAHIPLRSITEVILRSGATSVILAHNHPRGFALPSEADIRSTQQLHLLLHTLNVELLDHLIVAETDYVSMAESGLLGKL